MAEALEHFQDQLPQSTSKGPGRVPVYVAWSGWPGLGHLQRTSLRAEIETTFECETGLFACGVIRVCVC